MLVGFVAGCFLFAGWFLWLVVFRCWLVFVAGWFLLFFLVCCWLFFVVVCALWLDAFCLLVVFCLLAVFLWLVGFCCWFFLADAPGSSAAPDAPARRSTSRPLQRRTKAVRHSQHVVRGRGPPGRSGFCPKLFLGKTTSGKEITWATEAVAHIILLP